MPACRGAVWRSVRHNETYNRVILRGRRGVAKGGRDPKEEALAAERSLNPRPEAVRDAAFTAGGAFFDARDLVQVKYEMVRRVRADDEPVTRAAAAFGFSRPAF